MTGPFGPSLRLETLEVELPEFANVLADQLADVNTAVLAQLYHGTSNPVDRAIAAVFWLRHGRDGGAWPTQSWRGENLFDVVKVCPHARSAHDVKHQVKRYIEVRAIPGLSRPAFECLCGWQGQEYAASTDGHPMRMCRYDTAQAAWPIVEVDGQRYARVCHDAQAIDDPFHGQWSGGLGLECLCGGRFGGKCAPALDPKNPSVDRLLPVQ